MGEKGHDVDNCIVLTYKVQLLINKKILSFQESEPNVHQNPLTEHNVVNMVLIEGEIIRPDDEDEYEAKLKIARQEDACFRREAFLKGEIIDNLRKDSGKYNFQVKYTPPPWAFKSEMIVPDGWGGMDNEFSKQNETPSSAPFGGEMDQFEEQKEKIQQGERRFTQTSLKQGNTVDLLDQDSGKYNFRVKYTPPSWAFKSETIVCDRQGGMDEIPVNK